MATDRRSFLALLGFGAAAAVVAPRITPSAPEAKPEPTTVPQVMYRGHEGVVLSSTSPSSALHFAEFTITDRWPVNVR